LLVGLHQNFILNNIEQSLIQQIYIITPLNISRMKEKIKQLCEYIEKENNVEVLFAVENGSRAWRMESKNSDYDVRFVFVRPTKDYIQIDTPRNVIEAAFDKDGNSCPVKGSLIDISGFDIFKYVRLLSNSNPTTIEWLMSDIVYCGKQNEIFKSFALNKFTKKTLYLHYKSLCKNNYLNYIKSGKLITYKKYLYAYRGLVNAKWVVNKNTIPPIIFADAMAEMKNIIPNNILNNLENIIELKSQGKEKDIIQNIVELDKYIETFFEYESETPDDETNRDFDELNDELRKIVLGDF
jgi:uncharacterized protein